jgi:hypothetical protein
MFDFFELDAQHLLGIVPFVERGVGIQALVTLQPYQLGVEHFRQHFSDLSLADPRFAFQKQRFPHN